MKIFLNAALLSTLFLMSSCSHLGHNCKEETQCKMKKEDCNKCCKGGGMKDGEQCSMHGAGAEKAEVTPAKK